MPAGGLPGFAALLALLILAARLRGMFGAPAGTMLQLAGLVAILAGGWLAARAADAEAWIDHTSLAQAGLALLGIGLAGRAGLFAALVDVGLLALTRAALALGFADGDHPNGGQPSGWREYGWNRIVGMLALAALPPGGLCAGTFLILRELGATSPVLATVVFALLTLPLWRLPRLLAVISPAAVPWCHAAPAWILLGVATLLGIAMPGAVSAWIADIAVELG